MITVVPPTFAKVEYDAGQIAGLATEALTLVPDLWPAPDLEPGIEVRVDEHQATTRASVVSTDPVVLAVDSGALENLKDPRRLGAHESKVTFTYLYLELLDRRSASFGAPEVGATITHAHRLAWDVNLYGRVARLGLRLHPPRFRYDFRNRHGFTDKADRVFDLLWATDGLSFARIVELSDQAVDAVGITLNAEPPPT